MTESTKKQIVKNLSDGKLWRRFYELDNRGWFIRTFIDHFLSQGLADSAIEPEIKEVIIKATEIVSQKIKSKAAGPEDLQKFWDDKTDGVSIRQIIYNLIALHPKFLDPANKNYLDFIIDRRIRMIKRMQYFVNPNSRGHFRYPGGLPPEGVALLKTEAAKFWTGLVVYKGFLTKPFVLNATKGKLDPVGAVTKIFEKEPTSNFFYCDDVIGTLMMDSLLTANDPKKLLLALDSEGPEHFKIDHPYHHYGTYDDNFPPEIPRAATVLAVAKETIIRGSNIPIFVGNSFGFFDDATHAVSDNTIKAVNETVSRDLDFEIASGTRYLIALGDVHEEIIPVSINFQTRKLVVSQLLNDYNKPGAKIYIARKYPPPNQNKPYPVYHFMNDSRPDKAFFDQANISLQEMQVGDSVKALNHSLYSRYITGPWGEENAVVMQMAVHSTKHKNFDSGIKLAGHGLSMKDGSGQSAKLMATELLAQVNNALTFFSEITRIHLDNFHFNGTSNTDSVKVKTKTEGTENFNYFEYDVPFEVYVFVRNISFKVPFPFQGFVIKQKDGEEKAFRIYNINTKNSDLPRDQPLFLPVSPYVIKKFDDIFFLGNEPDFETTKTQLSKWGVRYLDKTAMQAKSLFLFEKDNKTPKRLGLEDLKQDRSFFYCLDNEKDVFSSRPKVDFEPIYQSFLKSSGAIL